MILLNGQPAATLDLRDRGLHYGDGLFETLAVRNGQPLLWQAHMDRLAAGCRRLRFPEPDSAQLLREAYQVLPEADRATLKIIVTRGVAGRGYRPPHGAEPTRLVMGLAWPDYPDEYQRTGVAVRLCDTRLAINPVLAGLKHLNRLEQVLARGEWDDDGIAEGLMCDTAGHLIEGTMSNLFLVRNGKLVTPSLEGCGVAGVMRAQVMAAASELGIRCETAQISLEDACAAEAMFLTNSLLGLWPVRRFEQHDYAQSPMITKLQQQLRHNHACA